MKDSRFQRGWYPPAFVFRARDTLTDETVFVKTIRNPDDEGFPRRVIQEASILRESSHHPNIVQFLNCITESDGFRRTSIVYECYDPDLSHFLTFKYDNSHLPQALVNSIFY